MIVCCAKVTIFVQDSPRSQARAAGRGSSVRMSGAIYARQALDSGRVHHVFERKPLSALAGAETDDIAVGQESLHSGYHRVHIAAGVAAQVYDRARKGVGKRVQHRVGIFDAFVRIAGKVRKRNHGDAVILEGYRRGRPLRCGILRYRLGALYKGMLAAGPSANRPFLSIMRTALRTKALFASEQDTATAKAIVIKNNLLSILYQLYSKINNKLVPGIG